MSLKRIILHIGRHKSGTSALQQSLTHSRNRLDAAGFLYPHAGTGGRVAHHMLAQALHPAKTAEHGFAKETLARLRAELRDHHEVLIFSSEAFQNLPRLERLTEFLKQLPPVEVQIICYVREFLDYAVSGFCQKTQNQTGFQTFSGSLANPLRIDAFLDRWSAIGAMSLRWYERSTLRNRDIIDDVIEQIGLDVELERPDGNANPSIGGNLLFLKAAANAAKVDFLGYNQMRNLALEHAPFRTGFCIPDDVAQAVRARSTYNSVLFERLGPVRLKSWATLPVIPDEVQLAADTELLAEHLDPQTLAQLVALKDKARDWFSLQNWTNA